MAERPWPDGPGGSDGSDGPGPTALWTELTDDEEGPGGATHDWEYSSVHTNYLWWFRWGMVYDIVIPTVYWFYGHILAIVFHWGNLLLQLLVYSHVWMLRLDHTWIMNQWEFEDPKMEVKYQFSGPIFHGYDIT